MFRQQNRRNNICRPYDDCCCPPPYTCPPPYLPPCPLEQRYPWPCNEYVSHPYSTTSNLEQRYRCPYENETNDDFPTMHNLTTQNNRSAQDLTNPQVLTRLEPSFNSCVQDVSGQSRSPIRGDVGHNEPIRNVNSFELTNGDTLRFYSGSIYLNDGIQIISNNDSSNNEPEEQEEPKRHQEPEKTSVSKLVNNDKTEITCPVCLDNNVDIVLTSCSHTLCSDCVQKITGDNAKCPLCRKHFDEINIIQIIL